MESTVKIENTEIFDQAHQMYAEGSSGVYPNIDDIQKLLLSYGWGIYDVDIWEDTFQGCWRWACKIVKI